MKKVIIVLLLCFCAHAVKAQIRPEGLARDYFVKLMMKDSSEFYGIVLSKPVPDRITFETRYGRLEIPLEDIYYAVDYRYNFVLSDNVRKDALANTVNAEKKKLSNFLIQSRIEAISIIHTTDHDIYRGYRYNFDDSAHVVLSTAWGELYFTYPQVDHIENYTGNGDTRKDFFSKEYLAAYDPRSWSAYLTPNALGYGGGKGAIVDYLFAGLQLTYGVTDWLSINGGGAFIPFLPNTIQVATGGLKITPYQGEEFSIAAGGQAVYSHVVKDTRFLFGYGVATYGNWQSNISILGGISAKHETDTNHFTYTSEEAILAISGAHRVGENLKLMAEFYFISNFGLVPFVATMRYFDQNFTIDIGVVFSLYKSGESRKTPSIGESVFGVADFPVIPIISGSYHF